LISAEDKAVFTFDIDALDELVCQDWLIPGPSGNYVPEGSWARYNGAEERRAQQTSGKEYAALSGITAMCWRNAADARARARAGANGQGMIMQPFHH
jgi:hypothetical protein